MSTPEHIDAILAFWFGADGSGADTAVATIAARQSALWWGKDAAVDQDIKSRFETDLLATAGNQRDDWADTPQGMLALILLLDQFSRNMYRDTAKAFSFDALAQQCCHLGLAQGFDQQLSPLQRVFFYLPLEHSEDLDDQEYAVQLFRTLARQSAKDDPACKASFDNYLKFADQHHAIIERFGRFPHRNAILGRPSTAEEAAFLKEPHSSF
ncbi:hypothetical protein hmeg3_05180 [Herbaspirillum sp. meg3]|uniref:DUF924 family protein n=1 Tax=Herbaspirillum sp. meg3 TaxID=2025949 RepID=UPI000B987946|nr:DUF924 family protein [Herbaspirillum sp. meg3]ASU37748.1 hypothetical protein hmeg3_05180 [Herbaspirillum sp. meg3]